MRRFLAIAYDFPPAGGAGVQRTVKFLRFLDSLGWHAVVIAPAADGSGPGSADPTLLTDIPERTRVIRVPGPEPARNSGVRGRLERWLRLPPAFATWWCQGVERAAAAAGPVDLVYATMPPFASADAGAAAARLLGAPLIADLRDAWVLDELQGYPSRFHRSAELRRMERLLSQADAIVWNTDEASHRSRTTLRGLPERQVTIRNGYDPDDFAAPAPSRVDDTFRIVHTGTFLTDHAADLSRGMRLRSLLGGAPPADARGRSPVYLLAALDLLFSRRPEYRQRIEVHLAGNLSDDDESAIRSRSVHTHGYLSHAKTLELVRGADLLFLPMHRLPAAMRSSSAPGKTYEYLAAERPILAAVPEGDVRDIIVAAGNGHVADPDDIDAMASAIEWECDRWARGAAVRRPQHTVLAQHQRQVQAAALAKLFERVVEERAASGAPDENDYGHRSIAPASGADPHGREAPR